MTTTDDANTRQLDLSTFRCKRWHQQPNTVRGSISKGGSATRTYFNVIFTILSILK